jgi:tetratricopeptide (TPR) repeat protein
MTKALKPKSLQPAKRMRIEELLAAGDIAAAADVAEVALKGGASDPMLLNLAAWRREEAGDYRGAHELLQRAWALAPGDVLIMGAIGAVLRKERRFEEALAMLDRTLATDPRNPAAWLERGYALDALRSDEAAVESYRKALSFDPNLAPALGRLADVAAKAGRQEEARACASRALAINRLEPAATYAFAVMEIEAGDGTAAAARLRALLEAPLQHDDRTRALTLLGDALDKQGAYAEAFEAYREGQRVFREGYAEHLAPGADRPSHRGYVERIAGQVERAPPIRGAATADATEGRAATHVFLLGYPRSGTTLVENILASAPDVVALEEHPTFADIDRVLVAEDGTMPDLDTVDPALLTELRGKYWQRVKGYTGDVEGRIFVDMNPYNGIKLPVIARLFPAARILIMRRDPRDVVLSCFKINFTPSLGAYALSDLEEAARHYDAMMRLIELCRARLPLAYHEVRYDRLVADFEPTVRAMAEFVGLEWTEDFRAFDKTAKTRGVRTASATQVRRGLYDGGGRWRCYREQLAPVLPILAPWVARLGFAP